MLDAFLEELALAPVAEVDSTRLGLRLPPTEMADLRPRLHALLEEYAARPNDPTI
ncbi:hypothetical protein PUR71_07835 [Streptomyces sp. SP17BM10]|uniref:hypothetical protein n=1 Tax=Streptomyces sp. SP17BM10 TaxID=3002530 RepID=UPI002E76CFC8|nr:hypothetical protein [Streptomyces sp. SP17BM10]MEE1782824.1 hypothetical protein [Streptomyces sp. SP17BM10]